MKSVAAVAILLTAGVVFACAGDAEAPYVPPSTGGVGGASTTGGSAGVGTGGAMAGIGGATGGTGGSLGGSAGVGGATGGVAGSLGGTAGVGTGGSLGGSAGAGVATGGVAGSMAAGGAAGTGNAGGMSGSDGQSGGMAGMSAGAGNMGGVSAGGSAGQGAGTAGTGTAGTGPMVPTVQQLVGALDGHLVVTPCGNTPSGDDCTAAGWRSNAVNNGANTACSAARLEAVIPFDVNGTAGAEYDVTMRFYGIMEPRQYSNVMREAGGATDRNGGTPTGWATASGNAAVYNMGDNNYNTYEIFVYSDRNRMNRVAQYFLNSDSGTGHYTFIINYEKTITLIGGGQVVLRVYDANCTMIKNCGPNGGMGAACATNARTVDISAAMPQPMGMPMLQQPALGNQGGAQHSGQWWLIDVKSVALAN